MEKSPFYTPTAAPKKPNKRFRKLLFFLVVLLFLSGAGFFLYQSFFGSSSQPEETTSVTPTPTEFIFPTSEPTSDVTESPTQTTTIPTKAVTPTTTQGSVDKTTGLDRAAITIAVQNGSGVTGAASKMGDYLRGLGYKIGTVGNADTADYTDVTIQVKSSQAKYLPLLKTDLSKEYTVGSSTSDLPASSSADALVI